jgi:hypothetical protein
LTLDISSFVQTFFGAGVAEALELAGAAAEAELLLWVGGGLSWLWPNEGDTAMANRKMGESSRPNIEPPWTGWMVLVL